jgi:hypothetical protein
MNLLTRIAAGSIATLGLLAGPAFANDYSESLNGEISADRFNPTRILLSYGAASNNGSAGNNIVSGTLGRSAGGVIDRDYFTAVVPPGYALTELRVGNQTTVGGGGSFLGLAAGSFMPLEPSVATAAGLLGWKVYGTADRTTDILDDMAVSGNGASGFTRPLEAGEYTFWAQELATGSFNYRFNLMLAPVPEPAPWIMLGAGLALLGLRRRRQPA